MELLTSAVQSYQTNQNLAGWVSETERQQAVGSESSDHNELIDDSVQLGERHRVFEWIAQTFPINGESAASLHRVNQSLFDYNLLSLPDIQRANELLNDKPNNVSINQHLAIERENTDSFLARQQIDHLIQVYTTLEAAAERTAA